MRISVGSGSRSAGGPDLVASGRLVGVDRLRGLAVVLMVVDHALVVAHMPLWLRLGPTRVAWPLFCVCAGVVASRSGPSWRRLGPAVVVEVVVGGVVLGLGVPGPVLLIGLSLLLWSKVFTAWQGPGWVVVTALAVVQATTWPVPWTGYQPGQAVALVGVGVAASSWALSRSGDRLPSALGSVGRRPLGWYCGHLVVLAVLVVVL